MKRQTDLQLIGYINKYGCFFMCIVYYYAIWLKHPEPTYFELNEIWDTAIERGIISGDLNNDGDLDDSGECLIGDKVKLLSLAGIKARYELVDAQYTIKPGEYAIAEMYNAKTKFTHFVVIDAKRNIVYDPIKNSITARDGVIKTIRILRSA